MFRFNCCLPSQFSNLFSFLNCKIDNGNQCSQSCDQDFKILPTSVSGMYLNTFTQLILMKRLYYRGMVREKGRNIHSYMEIVVTGNHLFPKTTFKVSTHIQITVVNTYVHKQTRYPWDIQPPSVPRQTYKMCRISCTGCTKWHVPLHLKSFSVCMRQLPWARGLCMALQHCETNAGGSLCLPLWLVSQSQSGRK